MVRATIAAGITMLQQLFSSNYFVLNLAPIANEFINNKASLITIIFILIKLSYDIPNQPPMVPLPISLHSVVPLPISIQPVVP